MRKRKALLRDFFAAAGIRWNTPLEKLKPAVLEEFIRGDGDAFPGLLVLLENEYKSTSSDRTRQRLEAFRGRVICPECDGARLRAEAAAGRPITRR